MLEDCEIVLVTMVACDILYDAMTEVAQWSTGDSWISIRHKWIATVMLVHAIDNLMKSIAIPTVSVNCCF